ncbi:MAG: hypothetical protein ACOC1D_01030 [Prolixibacteraceae bacterium]
MPQRYFLQLSYKGTNYHGWQVQPNAISVQEVLEKALSTILREDISVVGAGRTDTGVHASFFMLHFDTSNEKIEREKLVFKLNSFLPEDIAVQQIYPVLPVRMRVSVHCRAPTIIIFLLKRIRSPLKLLFNTPAVWMWKQ